MPTFQFEAMDATGAEIKDVIEAPTEEEAQATIRQMGYFVTKINVKKVRKKAEAAGPAKKNRGFVIGGVKGKELTTFTRQLSILQDAGLPILRSLRILAEQAKPGRLKYSLEDTCDEIEGGATLSEAMSKSPKCFDRLYVNMIKAGEAGGALELILQRLADFKERAESLKRKVQGAMIYPVVVVTVAVGILTFIMIAIVPEFEKIFTEFGLELPAMTLFLVATLQLDGQLLVPDPRHPDQHLAVHQAAAEVQTRPHRLGPVHHQGADLRPPDRTEHPRPHDADARHADRLGRADPRGAATSPATRRATRSSRTCSRRSARRSARARRSPPR